jgi:HEAT repeat protein
MLIPVAMILGKLFKRFDTSIGSVDITAGVRIEAARALGQIRHSDPEAVDALVRVLDEKDKQLRRAVCEALGANRSQAAVPSLVTLLTADDFRLRCLSVSALGKIGTNRFD